MLSLFLHPNTARCRIHGLGRGGRPSISGGYRVLLSGRISERTSGGYLIAHVEWPIGRYTDGGRITKRYAGLESTSKYGYAIGYA